MGKISLSKGFSGKSFIGIGPPTREAVRVRARTLASIEGRTPTDVSQTDYEQAKRELTGKSGLDQQEAMLDLLPETNLADHVPGSTGHQILESPSEGEDDEGRSESEQLVEKGVAQAEQDQIHLAAQVTKKNDRRDQ